MGRAASFARPPLVAAELRNLPLLAALTDDQAARLCAGARRRWYVRNERIVRAGDPAAGLHVITSGLAQVEMGERGERQVILAILGPGGHFGEVELIDGNAPQANVIARQACEMVSLDRATMLACLDENPRLAAAFTRSLARRAREADERIASLALLDVQDRVARLLVEKSQLVEGRRVIADRISKQDIARMTGASRERVSRVMTELRQRGLIEVTGRSILLRESIGRAANRSAAAPELPLPALQA
jgi:CRP/FNR family cyclic AMP-dependent transcriptional regulator